MPALPEWLAITDRLWTYWSSRHLAAEFSYGMWLLSHVASRDGAHATRSTAGRRKSSHTEIEYRRGGGRPYLRHFRFRESGDKCR